MNFEHKKWFIAILALKILIALFFVYMGFKYHADFMSEYGMMLSNDWLVLLGPVDNLVTHGVYGIEPGSNVSFAGRLPGYAVAYMPFRFLFGQEAALGLLLLAQIVLSAFAAWKMGWVVFDLTKRKWTTIIFWMVSLVFSYYVSWEVMTYAEGFSVAAYMLSLYYLYRYLQEEQVKSLVMAGFFMGWLFFLRGFLIFYFIGFAWIIVFTLHKKGANLKRMIIHLLLFGLPFAVGEMTWIARNLVTFGQFIPLQNRIGPVDEVIDETYDFNSVYKGSVLKVRDLIAAWGGDNVHYYPNSEMGYFLNKEESSLEAAFSPNLFTPGFTADSVRALRKNIQASFNDGLTHEEHLKMERVIFRQAREFLATVQSEHPKFLVLGPLHRIKNLVAHNVVGNWQGPAFSESPLIYKGYKLATLLAYALTWFLGMISSVYILAFERKNSIMLLLLMNTLFLLITFAFLVNVAEFKYGMTGNVSLLIVSLYCLSRVQLLYEKKSRA